MWIVHDFCKIKFFFLFWPVNIFALFNIFVASLAALIVFSIGLLNISAGMSYRNLKHPIQHAQTEFNISLIYPNLLFPLYSLFICVQDRIVEVILDYSTYLSFLLLFISFYGFKLSSVSFHILCMAGLVAMILSFAI